MKPKILKLRGDVLVIPLTEAFNDLFAKGLYPKEWSGEGGGGVMVSCVKQGDPMDCGSCRGITLVPMLDKLYSLFLNKRLTDWAEKNDIRAFCQAGFKKNYRTADQLFIHRTLKSAKAQWKNLFRAYKEKENPKP
jgi:hypothetical protein